MEINIHFLNLLLKELVRVNKLKRTKTKKNVILQNVNMLVEKKDPK